MNAYTKLSGKGQVVVPKAVRDRLGWASGIDLDVIETSDGVLLRQRSVRRTITPDEAIARFRQLYQHKGPPVTLLEMDEAIAEEVERRVRRSR